VAAGDCAPDSACRILDLARALVAIGARDEAMLVMARWSAREAAGEGDALLDASRIAYAAGRPRVAIRYALDAADAMPEARAWAAAPWAYPAAHDSLYMNVEVAPADGLDRALLRAVTWQESRFDQEAVSRSNAIGLMQLKLPAATDVSRWRGERAPREDDLADPELNLRYGAHYLHAMLRRFDGNAAAALGAYNAGAGRVPNHWRTILARGGEALLAEMMPFDETRNYVSRVLAARAAYLELRPFSAR
jgi:soluble lytic murein transglycosylase-like protein